jgi:hypothetical protein
MGFWMGEVWFLTSVKVAKALDGVLAGMGEVGFLALVKMAGALDGILAG